MKANRILFVSQELVPFTVSNEVSEACRRLPQAIQERGHEIRTFMPKWGCINERRNQLHEVIRLSGMNLIIDDTDHPLIIKVASLQMARMQVYFIDNDDYFSKTRIDDGELLKPDFADNDERCIFFARGVLETVKKLRWVPDVIHLQGWIGALIALYVKVLYKDEPSYRNSKIVLSLYGNEFQSIFRDDFLTLLRTKNMSDFDTTGIEPPFDSTMFLKLAVKYSDGIIVNADDANTAVIDYARELGKPILEKPSAEDYCEACDAFYEAVCTNEQ